VQKITKPGTNFRFGKRLAARLQAFGLSIALALALPLSLTNGSISGGDSSVDAGSGVAYADGIIPDAPTRPQAFALGFVSAKTNYLGGLVLDNTGKVWTWGKNIYGQLGVGASDTGFFAGGMIRIPYFVDNNINIVAIEGGYHTSFALDDQGVVYAWGKGAYGSMGNGKSTETNTAPVVVSSLSGIKIVKLATSTELENTVFAIDDRGNVYAWGSGSYNKIPGTTAGTNNTARRITQLSGIGIKDIVLGEKHGLAMTNDGKVYAWGYNGSGQLGIGNTTTCANPTLIGFFNSYPAIAISAESHTSMAVTSDGKAWIWGTRYVMTGTTYTAYQSPANPMPMIYSPNGKAETVKTPQVINFSLATSMYYTTAPRAVSVIAGRYTSYLIDAYGRTWYLGWNPKYTFATDGRLFATGNGGKHNTYVTDATLLLTMGDGDTETNPYDVKAPVFSGVTSAAYFDGQFNSYKTYGQWAELGNGLHPTVYDKKYMQTTDDGVTTNHTYKYPLDSNGNRLVYVVRKESVSPLKFSGNFYIASPSYTGPWIVDNKGTTALPAGVGPQTSIPAIRAEERGWIGASVDLNTFDYTGRQLNLLPYMTSISTYQSATLFLDNRGNLYMMGSEACGSIPWGWDYSVYERGTSGNNSINGLYNMYFKEVVALRGVPGVGEVNVAFEQNAEKIYLVADQSGNTPTSNIKVKVTVPAPIITTSMQFSVFPTLTELKYLFIPYDTADSNFNISDPSADQFQAAWNSGSYATGNLLNPGTNYAMGYYEFNIPVSNNGRVWVMAVDRTFTHYSYHLAAFGFDNFYTPVEVTHRGIGEANANIVVLYGPTADGVEKLQPSTSGHDDGIPLHYGIPLDANGNAISNPTYGYDRVRITKNDALLGDRITLWEFHTPQDTSVELTLDNPSIFYDMSGNLQPYVHDFIYDLIRIIG